MPRGRSRTVRTEPVDASVEAESPFQEPSTATPPPPPTRPESTCIKIKEYRRRQDGVSEYATGKFRVVADPTHNFLFPGEVVEVPVSFLSILQNAFSLGLIEETREPATRPLFYESEIVARKFDPRRGDEARKRREREEQQRMLDSAMTDMDAQRARERQITLTAR